MSEEIEQKLHDIIRRALSPLTPVSKYTPTTLEEAQDHLDGLTAEISAAVDILHESYAVYDKEMSIMDILAAIEVLAVNNGWTFVTLLEKVLNGELSGTTLESKVRAYIFLLGWDRDTMGHVQLGGQDVKPSPRKSRRKDN